MPSPSFPFKSKRINTFKIVNINMSLKFHCNNDLKLSCTLKVAATVYVN